MGKRSGQRRAAPLEKRRGERSCSLPSSLFFDNCASRSWQSAVVLTGAAQAASLSANEADGHRRVSHSAERLQAHEAIPTVQDISVAFDAAPDTDVRKSVAVVIAGDKQVVCIAPALNARGLVKAVDDVPVASEGRKTFSP
jgi:hypothetical protein